MSNRGEAPLLPAHVDELLLGYARDAPQDSRDGDLRLANNQLAEPRHRIAVRERGITYVPDYVVNAGGMIGASQVSFATPDHEASLAKIERTYDTILEILEEADASGRAPCEGADGIARARTAAAQAVPVESRDVASRPAKDASTSATTVGRAH